MKASYLKKFIAPDDQAFASLLRHLGFVSGACYRLQDNEFTLLFATEPLEETGWPAAINFTSDYTLKDDGGLPVGWVRAAQGETPRKFWPKGTNLYFADQEWEEVRIIIAVKNAAGRRCRLGEMYGPLEGVAGRVRAWINNSTVRSELAEQHFKQQLSTLGADLTEMIDHELRTPLASIAGYLSVLKDYQFKVDNAQDFRKYVDIVSQQTRYAINALDKLSVSMRDDLSHMVTEAETEKIDLVSLMEAMVEEIQHELKQFVHPSDNRKFKFVLRKAEDQICYVQGSEKLLRTAFYEVLKNAVIHSHNGNVTVTVYRTDHRVVVDVEDDGRGVSLGSDELIFLRFFQEPTNMMSRKGKRGLGLGLFLARYITEKHSGRLNYVRHKEKGGLFRFIFSAAQEQEVIFEERMRLGA